jgi:heme/copper-type cytochrome/quinol oxidase subunit 2
MTKLIVLIVVVWLTAFCVWRCERERYDNRAGPTQDGGVGGHFGGRADGR